MSEQQKAIKPGIRKSEPLRDKYPLTNSIMLQRYVCESNGKTVDINDLIYYFTLEEETDEEKLCRVIKEIVEEHPTYQMGVDIEKKEMFLKKEPFEVEILNLDEEAFTAFRQSKLHWIRDLRKDPLLEAKIIHQGGKRYVFFDFSHLIYDGISLEMFLKTVEQRYNGEESFKEVFSVFDVAEYEENLQGTPFYEEAVSYMDQCYQDLPACGFFKGDPCSTTATVNILDGVSQEKLMERIRELHSSQLNFHMGALELTVKRILKQNDFTYAVIHTGRKMDGLATTYGVLANAVIQRSQGEIGDLGTYLFKIHEEYKNLINYNVLSVPEMVERYPNVLSGITFNYYGSIQMIDRLMLGGKANMGNEAFYYEALAAMQPFTPCDLSIRTYGNGSRMGMIASAKIPMEEANAFLEAYNQTLRAMLETDDIAKILEA